MRTSPSSSESEDDSILPPSQVPPGPALLPLQEAAPVQESPVADLATGENMKCSIFYDLKF